MPLLCACSGVPAWNYQEQTQLYSLVTAISVSVLLEAHVCQAGTLKRVYIHQYIVYPLQPYSLKVRSALRLSFKCSHPSQVKTKHSNSWCMCYPSGRFSKIKLAYKMVQVKEDCSCNVYLLYTGTSAARVLWNSDTKSLCLPYFQAKA